MIILRPILYRTCVWSFSSSSTYKSLL